MFWIEFPRRLVCDEGLNWQLIYKGSLILFKGVFSGVYGGGA
jgi:hypothetical protein